MKLAVKPVIASGVFALCSLFIAFAMAWVVLFYTNFSYGLWHDVGGIGAAIDKYGPQNYYRSGFGETSKAQREQLFLEINQAVHNDGVGLEKITYKVDGHPEQTLSIRSEVGHLRDVAHLVNGVQLMVFCAFIIWCVFIVRFYWLGLKPPSIWGQLGGVVAFIVLFIAVLLLVGPTKAFSKMHEWVFPSNSQWFFYYQQSLMSTMMWAPVLFAWIAGIWAIYTLFFFALVQAFSVYLLRWLPVRKG